MGQGNALFALQLEVVSQKYSVIGVNKKELRDELVRGLAKLGNVVTLMNCDAMMRKSRV